MPDNRRIVVEIVSHEEVARLRAEMAAVEERAKATVDLVQTQLNSVRGLYSELLEVVKELRRSHP